MARANHTNRGDVVTIAEPERMSLLGLMVASMLERRLHGPSEARHLQRLRGSVVIDCSGMRVTLEFERGRVTIRREPPEGRAAARILGSLTALLDAALGRRIVRNLLTGRLRARGKPMVLLRALSLLRA